MRSDISSGRCFNPRAPCGARPALMPCATSTTCFNSRAREGRDSASLLFEIPSRVSIHAPARGATLDLDELLGDGMFQFTRPRGARQERPASTHRWHLFQFTRPRGARQKVSGKGVRRQIVSIHAPARGATTGWRNGCGERMFQFTRPRGARPDFWERRCSIGVSIHAPARGATFDRDF